MNLAKSPSPRAKNDRSRSRNLNEIMIMARQIREAHSAGKITAEHAAILLSALYTKDDMADELQIFAGQ